MGYPVNAPYEVRIFGTTPVRSGWGNATDAAVNGLYGATRSLLGLALDATGYVSRTVAAATIKAFGAALDLQSDTGLVTATGSAGFKVITGSGGQGTIDLNDTTMAYGGVGQQCYPFQVDANGTTIFRTLIGAVQTTDGSTFKTALTLVGMPNPSAFHLVTSVCGIDSTHLKLVRAVYCDGYRRTGGGIVEATGSTKVMMSADDEVGVTLLGTASQPGTWGVSGSNVIFQVKGKAATTINWLVKVDILINV